MPPSKHTKAQRRIRGTTYKLVRRGYQEQGTATGGMVISADDAAALEMQERPVTTEWVKEGDANRAHANKRSRAIAGGGGGGGSAMGGGGSEMEGYDDGAGLEEEWGDYDDGEEDEEGYYDEEEGEYYYYEDGDDGEEWEDEPTAGPGVVLVGKPTTDNSASFLVSEARQHQPDLGHKKVKFDLTGTSGKHGHHERAVTAATAMLDGSQYAPDVTATTSALKKPRSVRTARDPFLNDNDNEDENENDEDEIYSAVDDFDMQYEEEEHTGKKAKKARAAKAAASASDNNSGPNAAAAAAAYQRIADAAAASAAAAKGQDGAVDRDGDARLFLDEDDCEVTDDFLRQLVFGTGAAAGAEHEHEDDDGEGMFGDEATASSAAAAAAPFDPANPPAGMDLEVWNLLTEEERAAVLEGQMRGTQRRRRAQHQPQQERERRPAHDDDDDEGEDGGYHMLDEAAGVRYPSHDAAARGALERQFDAMLSEFDSDLKINDFFVTDADGNSTGVEFSDPRTQGALGIDKYMSALEEFVENRAGVDMETSEPLKNKGLLAQLRFLADAAGAFDYDAKNHGVFLTNNVSDKQRRFVEEYRTETERIKKDAKMRVLKRMLEDKRRREAGLPPPDGYAEDEPEKLDEYEVIEVRNRGKDDRLDVETAVSAYSSYYNQPNVIRVPSQPQRRRTAGGSTAASQQQSRAAFSGAGTITAEAPAKKTTATTTKHQGVVARGNAAAASSSSDDDADADHNNEEGEEGENPHGPVSYVRAKDETKEEKKARRAAVKALQRGRRQEKASLRKAYKEVEREEVGRAAVSQGDKRTVKFL